MRVSLHSVLPGVLGSLPALALAQSAPSWRYGDWPGPWHMWGWGFGWVFPLMFMVLIIGACAFLMSRMVFGHRHGHFSSDASASALRILSERFAKGEISKEEFEEKKSILARNS
jgi:putative membrane protein